MAKKLDPVAIKAASCLAKGDHAGFRRYRRRLTAKHSGNEVNRQLSVAQAQLRAERTQLRAVTA